MNNVRVHSGGVLSAQRRSGGENRQWCGLPSQLDLQTQLSLSQRQPANTTVFFHWRQRVMKTGLRNMTSWNFTSFDLYFFMAEAYSLACKLIICWTSPGGVLCFLFWPGNPFPFLRIVHWLWLLEASWPCWQKGFAFAQTLTNELPASYVGYKSAGKTACKESGVAKVLYSRHLQVMMGFEILWLSHGTDGMLWGLSINAARMYFLVATCCKKESNPRFWVGWVWWKSQMLTWFPPFLPGWMCLKREKHDSSVQRLFKCVCECGQSPSDPSPFLHRVQARNYFFSRAKSKSEPGCPCSAQPGRFSSWLVPNRFDVSLLKFVFNQHLHSVSSFKCFVPFAWFSIWQVLSPCQFGSTRAKCTQTRKLPIT